MSDRDELVFNEARGLAGAEREAFLRDACAGDFSLRSRVEALLKADAEAGVFLQTAEASDANATIPVIRAQRPTERPGETIGRYKLLQQIGEGGFGSVFMAEQEKPVSRKVALKIIKLGMDTRAVIARFEAERQALAMMDHPHIARVLDAGATDAGRPYFVMELCKGEAIVEYCDKNNLPITERLELFAQVCTAVQHAHTKGIIHRDIKPSNILVSTQDGRPHAKVIDFGIAKATAAKLTEKTLFTEHKALIGTPEYMSPEQAEGSLDIDTRTDVYSLGVLLYELLTGTTPFSAKELRSAAYAEIQRIIREVDPPKPSTRLISNTETIVSVAAHRHTEPRKLGTIVRGELDWIVMKALEKDRGRRYETANGLAMDIRRYLDGEAVLAAPPSRAYRMRKFVRRHRAQVAAGSLVGAALLLGMAGTAWQAKVASDRAAAANRAKGEATVARDRADATAKDLTKVSDFQQKMLSHVDAMTAGVRLTEDVNQRFAAALERVNVPIADRERLVEDFRHSWARLNATDAAAALVDETILKPAAKAIDEQFKDQPLLDARLRLTLAETYRAIGRYDAALPLHDSALKTRRRVLGDDHPDTIESIDNMGVLLRDWGKLTEAEPYLREAVERARRVLGENDEGTIASVGNLGFLLELQGKLPDAEALLREAMDKCRRVLGENHSFTIHSISLMGNVLQAEAKYEAAEKLFREALDKSRTSANIMNVGYILHKQGKLDEVEPYYREALEMDRRELGEDHPNTAGDINNLAGLYEIQGRNAEAEPLFREALEIRRRVLADEHPDLLQSVYNLGYVLQKQGKLEEAEPFFREFLDTRRRLKGNDHPDTIRAMIALGVLLDSEGKSATSEPLYRELVERAPRVLGERDDQTLLAFNSLGSALLLQRKFDEAEEVYARGVAACERAFHGPHPLTALLMHHHAESLRAVGRLEDARTVGRRALDLYRKHPEWGPGEAVHAATILSSILLTQGKRDEVIVLQREILDHYRQYLQEGNGPVLSSALATLGLALLQRGTLEDARQAEPVMRECVEIRVAIMPKDWRTSSAQSLLGAAILLSADLDTGLTSEARVARLREAEPLLLESYSALKDNPAVPPPALVGGDRRREALERVVRLYEARDRAEPGAGFDSTAAEWRAKLTEPIPTTKP